MTLNWGTEAFLHYAAERLIIGGLICYKLFNRSAQRMVLLSQIGKKKPVDTRRHRHTKDINTSNDEVIQSPNHALSVLVPPVVVHKLDPHTGIPFMPHIAASVTAVLQNCGFQIQVIDAFGLQPHSSKVQGEFMLLGAATDFIVQLLAPEAKVCLIYCRAMAEFLAIREIIAVIKSQRPEVKICLFENPQAVTAFSLEHLAAEFLDAGADALIWGDPENRIDRVVSLLCQRKPLVEIPGVATRVKGKVAINSKPIPKVDLDILPFPAWRSFPLQGYWQAGFTHGPREKYRFLPLLTSRGCPFRCRFCIVPHTNSSWQPHSPVRVVDEMEYFCQTLNVQEFHISDLNPTVDEKRIRQICREIRRRGLNIIWKLAQGTKIETLGPETLELMAEAGCRYLSFSPETGSAELLKQMNKPFDYGHALTMVRHMHRLGVRSQACFIAGLPGETSRDRRQTLAYVRQLVDGGLDEVAVFGFTPIPGSKLAGSMTGYLNYSQCTFNPVWRKDYRQVLAFRRRIYLTFFIRKLRWPRKIKREIMGTLTGRFQTKMEMSFYKLIKLYLLRYFPKFYGK